MMSLCTRTANVFNVYVYLLSDITEGSQPFEKQDSKVGIPELCVCNLQNDFPYCQI